MSIDSEQSASPDWWQPAIESDRGEVEMIPKLMFRSASGASSWVLVFLMLVLGFPPTFGLAQKARDVFPAVVFLQGYRGVETANIEGRQVELWYKDLNEASPQPLKLRSYGTGFIVMRESHIFLVTAQHVATSIPSEATATLRGMSGEPLTFELSELIRESAGWVNHEEADVSVIGLRSPESFRTAIKAVSFDELSQKNVAPELHLFLTVVGFPLELGVRGEFSPIVKVSHPASALFRYHRFDSGTLATFFILDDPSVAGFSGAPVFRLPQVRVGGLNVGQGLFECVGLVHGTFKDRTGGKFAAIVPAKFIAETVLAAVNKTKSTTQRADEAGR